MTALDAYSQTVTGVVEKLEAGATTKLDALTQRANGWLDKVIDRSKQ